MSYLRSPGPVGSLALLVTLFVTVPATLIVVAAAAPVDAQVLWTVYPNPAPFEQPVTLRLENRLSTTIHLPGQPGWGIRTRAGVPVTPGVSLPVIVPVPAFTTMVASWNQLDKNARQVAAGGYEAVVTYYDTVGKKLLVTPFQILPVTFKVSGKATPGGRVQLDLHAPTSAGAPYQMACALGDKPGLPIAVTRHLALNPDALFFLSILNPGGVFRNFSGTTNTSGRAAGFINIPNSAGLIGVTFHAAGVTLQASAPGGILRHSASKPITIL